MNLPSIQILVFLTPNKRNRGSLEKGLILGLGQGKYKRLGRLVLLENKEVLEKDWRHVERT